jgi:hypothetical protein
VPAPINHCVDGIPPEDARPTESQKVESWRLEQLLLAGYPLAVADALAIDTHIDLHQAVDLVARGCSPVVAARILA